MSKEIHHWIFPCNINYYNVFNAFAALGQVDWGTNNDIKNDDIVYIYISAPVSKLLLKALVVNDNVEEEDLIDDSAFTNEEISEMTVKNKYVTLKLLESFLGLKQEYLTFEVLKENGLKGPIKGPLLLENNEKLLKYITLVEV